MCSEKTSVFFRNGKPVYHTVTTCDDLEIDADKDPRELFGDGFTVIPM